MPDTTNAERQRRWRERQAGRLGPAQRLACSTCGAIHTGAHGSLCRNCWRKTADGMAWQRQRMAAYRARRSRSVTTDELAGAIHPIP